MMVQNSIARKILYPAAATALIVGGTVAAGPANALQSDNVHNTGAGGMTNCNGGDVCVKKVGDELEVSYEVQFGNSGKSSDKSNTVKGNMIAFPSVMKDAKLEVVATGKEGKEHGPSDNEMKSFPTHKFNKPVDVPTYTPEELDKKNIPYDGGEISFVTPKGGDSDKDSSYIKKYSPDNKEEKNEDRFFATHLKGENIINDFKKNGGSGDEVKGIGADGVSKDSIFYDKSLEKAGAMPVDSPYDYFVFNNDSMGVQTFKITGKVKTESDLAYLPIRAKEGFYRCGSEGNGFGITDKSKWTDIKYDDKGVGKSSERSDCDNLMNYEWARSDDTLPKYSLENNEVTKSNIKNDTPNGLKGSQKCAVTEDSGRYDRIEQDVKPRKLSSKDDSTSWGKSFDKEFSLHANHAVQYFVGGYDVAEDNCDQAGVKISLCNESDNGQDKPDTPAHKSDVDSNARKSDREKTGDNTRAPKNSSEDISTPENTNSAYSPDEEYPLNPESGRAPQLLQGDSKDNGYQGNAVSGPEVNTGGEVSTSFFSKIVGLFR